MSNLPRDNEWLAGIGFEPDGSAMVAENCKVTIRANLDGDGLRAEITLPNGKFMSAPFLSRNLFTVGAPLTTDQKAALQHVA